MPKRQNSRFFVQFVNLLIYRFKVGNSSTTGVNAFPIADDGLDHNAFFGMHYKVQFDLNADYAGPLEYYFFGDDDMWVFLGDGDGNGKLVCDIGGVHSSVGEFVDLWDYIDKEAEKIHRHDESCYENGELTCGYVDHKQFTLNFYYTERGESGSTCFMQFTLPSVSSMDSSPTYNDYGHLMVEKKVSMADDDVTGNGETFKFSANFKDEAEQTLRNKFFYAKYEHTDRCYDVDGVLCCNHDGSTDKRVDNDFVIYNGGSFTLNNNQYIIMKYLPVGAQYKITEDDAGYTDNGDGGTKPTETAYKTDIYINDNLVGDKENLSAERSITGKIAKDETTEIVFENKIEKKVVESGVLPKTGGCGTYAFMIVGSLMIAVAGVWLVWRRRKK